jgi:UDP-N-acetylmuramate: L-alanyl-gamma-D-glutamyl-meso-diaminopimelate ligase
VFDIRIKKGRHETVESPWNLSGDHNLENALAAISSAYKLGVSLSDSLKSLSKFSGVKRRLEKTATILNISIYDDFAHHPTAIRRTIVALKKQNPNQRVIVALELRSNTMKMGLHNKDLVDALVNADFVVMFAPSNFDSEVISSSLGNKIECFSSYNDLIFGLENNPNARGHLVVAWNPGQIEDMALPPCHCLFQFWIGDGKLSCQLYQRSADFFSSV